MQTQTAVNGLQGLANQGAQAVLLRVAHHHRVIVNDHMDVVLLQTQPLHIVNQLMAGNGVLPLIHLHMETAKTLTGAVVVDHQIVDAQHSGLTLHELGNQPAQLRRGGLTQQGADGLFGKTHGAVQNKERHCHAHVAVHLPAGDPFHHRCRQYRQGGDHIVAAVCRSGKQGGRINLLAQTVVEQAQPQLHQNGAHQHDHQGDREQYGLRMQDLLEGGLCQLKADEQHHGSHRKAGQILVSGVAVGVIVIRRPLRQLESHQRYNGAGGV